jgi:hypothetical protein
MEANGKSKAEMQNENKQTSKQASKQFDNQPFLKVALAFLMCFSSILSLSNGTVQSQNPPNCGCSCTASCTDCDFNCSGCSDATQMLAAMGTCCVEARAKTDLTGCAN